MAEIRHVRIEPLRPEQAEQLSELLRSAPEGYSRHFTPFAFDQGTIAAILTDARADQYFGVLVGANLAGFYMLRGFDQGYTVPSYGVWIAPQYAGLGLASLTLYHSFAWCRANGVAKLMLKVHPRNAVAKRIYEKHGFIATGIDHANGNIIYHRDIS